MRQFAGKAFHLLSDRIFHATEVLPGERAVRPLLSGKFVCYAGPSGFLDVLPSLSFPDYDKIGQASFVFSCLFCQILLADSGFLP